MASIREGNPVSAPSGPTPCAQGAAGPARSRERQIEIMERLTEILGSRRGSDAALVRAVFDLTADAGPDAPRRWCRATNEEIADRAGVSTRTAERRLPILVTDGVLTDIGPDHPSWPAGGGRQGRLRAPAWNVLEARLRDKDPQLALPVIPQPQSVRPTALQSSDNLSVSTDNVSVLSAHDGGGRGGSARQRRQLRFFFARADRQAERRHDEMAAHVQTAIDAVYEGLKRLIEQQFEVLFQFLKSHLGHDHDHEGDGVSKKEAKGINFRRAITREDLKDEDTVEELFGIAVAALPSKWRDTELDRITFFGLAVAARDKEKPGAWFNLAVAGKWASFVTIPIENRVRPVVTKILYGDTGLPRPEREE